MREAMRTEKRTKGGGLRLGLKTTKMMLPVIWKLKDAHIAALNQHRMSTKEYRWIGQRAFAALHEGAQAGKLECLRQWDSVGDAFTQGAPRTTKYRKAPASLLVELGLSHIHPTENELELVREFRTQLFQPLETMWCEVSFVLLSDQNEASGRAESKLRVDEKSVSLSRQGLPQYKRPSRKDAKLEVVEVVRTYSTPKWTDIGQRTMIKPPEGYEFMAVHCLVDSSILAMTNDELQDWVDKISPEDYERVKEQGFSLVHAGQAKATDSKNNLYTAELLTVRISRRVVAFAGRHSAVFKLSDSPDNDSSFVWEFGLGSVFEKHEIRGQRPRRPWVIYIFSVPEGTQLQEFQLRRQKAYLPR